MSEGRRLAPDEALDVIVRREGDYIVLEFIDAECDCSACGNREECYASGIIKLTRSEARRLAEMILSKAEKEKTEDKVHVVRTWEGGIL
jgi:hypothetical protein